MKKLVFLILTTLLFVTSALPQDIVLPFLIVLDWLKADSIHVRALSADSMTMSIAKVDCVVQKTAGHGTSFGSDVAFWQDVNFRHNSNTASYWKDASGNKIVTIDPLNAKPVVIATTDVVVDTANSRVGIRTASPSQALEVGSTTAGGNIKITATLESDLISNGAFASDLTGWAGANWAWSGGTALHTAGATTALSQAAATVVSGTDYILTFDIVGGTAGTVTPSCGGVLGTVRNFGSASYIENFTANATTALAFTPTTTFNGAIDNVVLKAKTVDTGDLIVDGSIYPKAGIKDDQGTRVMSFKNGNVGINTMQPVNYLQVGPNTSYTGNEFALCSGTKEFAIDMASVGPLFYSSTGKFQFSEAIVGIGDTGADAILEVSANAGASDLFMLSSDDANDGDRFIVKNNGNVGIETTVPTTKLQIGATSADDVQPSFSVVGDADLDASDDTDDRITLALTPNATPTLATWGFTSTQGGGYTFDKSVTIATTKHLTLGAVQWDNGSDKIDGEQIADNTIDADPLDFNYVASVATSAVTGLTGGAAGSEAAAISLAFDRTSTLAANPAIVSGGWVPSTTGIIFEGTTADEYEVLLVPADPTGADKTITYPNASGTVAVSATAPVTLSVLGDVGLTVAKDLVTGTGLTGGENDVFPGADADVTISHSTANGYVHTPADGSAAQLLQYSSAGTAKWITVSSDVTIADGGAMTVANDSHEHTTMVTLAVTGILSGKSDITLDSTSPIVLTAADCRNKARIVDGGGAKDYTLPAAETGLVILVYDLTGVVITIDTYDGVDTIYLDGVSVGAGDAIDSPGAVGNFIALMAIDDTRWISLGIKGVWIDGGVD